MGLGRKLTYKASPTGKKKPYYQHCLCMMTQKPSQHHVDLCALTCLHLRAHQKTQKLFDYQCKYPGYTRALGTHSITKNSLSTAQHCSTFSCKHMAVHIKSCSVKVRDVISPNLPTVERKMRNTAHPQYCTQLQGQKYSGVSRDIKS